MTIQGTVAGRACVHSKSSISDALQVRSDSVTFWYCLPHYCKFSVECISEILLKIGKY